MCLSFDYTAAMEAAMEGAADQALEKAEAKFNQHDDTSCDGTQVACCEMSDGSYQQLHRIPVVSKTAVMAMVSAPREVLGENHENIKPCENLPCLQAEIEAAMDPGKFVEVPEKIEVPVYRGLGGGDEEEAPPPTAAYVLPEIELDAGVCVANADGSKVMTLRTAEVAETDENIQKQIDAGKWRDKIDYLQAMKNAAWKEFVRACAENDVDMTALFECMDEKDENGRDVVAPEAVVTFMDSFYPCLLPGSDIIVLLPPIENGKAVMNTAFSLKLAYAKRPRKIWLPSLHHNDAEIEGDSYEQKENYFIWSNTLLSLKIPDFKTGLSTDIRLCQKHEFLPDNSHPKWVELAKQVGLVGSHMINYMRNHHLGDGETGYDYEAWGVACDRFQNKRHKSMLDRLVDAKAFGDSVVNDGELVMTNLIGTMIPKECNFATVCGFTPMGGSEHTRVLRERMTKRKKDDESADEPPAKRVASPQAAQPPSAAPAAAAAVDVTDVAMEDVEAPTTNVDPMDEAATQMLKVALFRITTVTHASMACMMARGMDPDYAPPDSTTKDDIKIDIMTTQHKTHLCTMIQAIVS